MPDEPNAAIRRMKESQAHNLGLVRMLFKDNQDKAAEIDCLKDQLEECQQRREPMKRAHEVELMILEECSCVTLPPGTTKPSITVTDKGREIAKQLMQEGQYPTPAEIQAYLTNRWPDGFDEDLFELLSGRFLAARRAKGDTP